MLPVNYQQRITESYLDDYKHMNVILFCLTSLCKMCENAGENPAFFIQDTWAPHVEEGLDNSNNLSNQAALPMFRKASLLTSDLPPFGRIVEWSSR